MLNLSKRFSKKSQKPMSTYDKQPPPGIYDSVVIDVKEAEGYASGNAIDIIYQLTDSSGKVFEKTERFFITVLQSEREANFFDYLESNGINVDDSLDKLNDFIGCHERLELAKEVKYFNTSDNSIQRKVFINITHRDFVSGPA